MEQGIVPSGLKQSAYPQLQQTDCCSLFQSYDTNKPYRIEWTSLIADQGEETVVANIQTSMNAKNCNPT